MSKPWHQSNQFQNLRAIFANAGFNIWLVGGAVRDFLRGEEPKDMDFATDATPEEQVRIYNDASVRFIPTGLQHGTITVLMDDEAFEITSLRIDVETDGRHAEVEFTRSIVEDLARRDLTVNAMAMDFDGKLIDPFGGKDDLLSGRIRFVGNAEERMVEDYLRILRFFRFHGRLAKIHKDGLDSLCPEAVKAIKKVRGGLSRISVERIWAEVSKIMTGRHADVVINQMRQLSLFEIIGMPVGFIPALRHAANRGVTDPASVMGWYVTNPRDIDVTASEWKWSSEERARAKFVAENGKVKTEREFKEMLVDGEPFEWVADVMRLNDMDPETLRLWQVPKMPVNGRDLMQVGVKPGPNMGKLLGELTVAWKASDYTLTRDQLLARVAAND